MVQPHQIINSFHLVGSGEFNKVNINYLGHWWRTLRQVTGAWGSWCITEGTILSHQLKSHLFLGWLEFILAGPGWTSKVESPACVFLQHHGLHASVFNRILIHLPAVIPGIQKTLLNEDGPFRNTFRRIGWKTYWREDTWLSAFGTDILVIMMR